MNSRRLITLAALTLATAMTVPVYAQSHADVQMRTDAAMRAQRGASPAPRSQMHAERWYQASPVLIREEARKHDLEEHGFSQYSPL